MDDEDIVSTLEMTSTALGLFTDTAGFVGAITKLSAIGGPLLMVTAQILTMILGLEAQESPELKEIKKVYNRMNTRFDQMSDKLDGVNREIVWTRTHIRFVKIEGDIRSNIRLLNKLYYSPPSSRSHYKAEFLKRYDRSYTDAGGKLYDAMVNSNHLFDTNIPLAVMKFTKNHRQKLQTFMMGITKLLYDSYKLEMAYLQLSNKSTAVRNEKIKTWERRMREVYTEVLAYDKQVESKWESQSEEDFDTLAAAKVDLNNQDFMKQVNDFLVAKYSWRRWFVVVYDDIAGSDNHAVRVRGGFHRFLFHGRNMLVASKTKEEKRMDLADAKSAVSRMVDTYTTPCIEFERRHCTGYHREAEKIFGLNRRVADSVPNYSIFGVVRRENGLCLTGDGAAISNRRHFDLFLVG